MKRRRTTRLGVVALALTLITMTMTGGPLARYVTEVTGNATAEVAAWSFKANESSETFTTIDLGDTTHRAEYTGTDIKTDVIAPGTSGSFDIVLDGSGSEVGVDYIVSIKSAEGTNLPSDFVFKVKNGANGTEEQYTLQGEITGTIDYNSSNDVMKKTITVSWEWPFDESDTKTANDNAYADKTWTLNITATGKQVKPEKTAASN